jgi:FkbM family methyltransferase
VILLGFQLSFLGKAISLLLRIIPSGTPVPILLGPMRGKRWIMGSSLHRCWLGTFEPSKQKLFSSAIKPGDVVYDLGANVGYYSLLAGILVGPAGQIFSFEPVPRNLSFLRRHLALNGVKNCTVFDAAVSRSNGTATFDFGPNAHSGHLGDGSLDATNVRTVTLDSLVESGEIKPPNLIKCDIEGAEFDALTGAMQTLSHYGPSIFLAVHGPEVKEKCCALLTSLGYRLAPIDGPSLDRTSEILAVR